MSKASHSKGNKKVSGMNREVVVKEINKSLNNNQKGSRRHLELVAHARSLGLAEGVHF